MVGIAKLNKRQRDFANEYIKTGHAYPSALKAGYSEKYAKAQSHLLLENVGIAEYIKSKTQAAIEQAEKDAIATKKEVLEFLTRQMRREEMEQIVATTSRKDVNYDEEGRKIETSTKDPVIVEVKTKNTDAIKAGIALAEHYGILTGDAKDADEKVIIVNDLRKTK